MLRPGKLRLSVPLLVIVTPLMWAGRNHDGTGVSVRQKIDAPLPAPQGLTPLVEPVAREESADTRGEVNTAAATSRKDETGVEPTAGDRATTEPRFRVRREKIYFGDSSDFATPAVLAASRVYDKIPAYRKILDKKLTRDDPEYWPLMHRASSTFVRGMKRVCLKRGYDLVGELGSIRSVRNKGVSVPEITAHVITAVRMDRIVKDVRRRLDGGGEAADDDAALSELVNVPDL